MFLKFGLQYCNVNSMSNDTMKQKEIGVSSGKSR